jgi:hypothetical protein
VRPSGDEIAETTDVPSGTIYAILQRFEDDTLVDSCWATSAADSGQRRRRGDAYGSSTTNGLLRPELAH